jgi:hypothetical protein
VVATTTFAVVSALFVDGCVVSIQDRVKIAGGELICSGVAQAKPVNISNCSEEANARAAILKNAVVDLIDGGRVGGTGV